MIIMECRRVQLEKALDGLNGTNIPLVATWDNIHTTAGYTDDLGIYYFIPWIAKTFGLPIDIAINIFFGILLFFGAAISTVCFYFLFKNRASRGISIAALLLLTFAAYRYSDVYIASYFVVGSIVPLFIIWSRTRCKLNFLLILSLVFSGLIIGYGNLIRFHSGTGILLFLLSWIFFQDGMVKREKILSVMVLFAFTCIPYSHFKYLEIKRDQFLTQVDPGYKNISISHPKWHSIYIGFGYLENKYGITYNDSIADEKVQSIKPNVVSCSDEYEQILKEQCFLFLKNDPAFVVKTVMAKLFQLLFRVLKFANFGLLIALFYVKPPLKLVLPFLVAGLFYSIPGVLTMPVSAYVSGLTSIATLFGVYMICLGIEKYQKFLPVRI